MRNPTAVSGSLAVVTGAGSGIGRATALALARRGARVVAVDIDEVSAKATAAECGGEAHQVDVADRDAMVALAAQVRAENGTPHIVINNAGVGMSGAFLDTTLEDWEWILGINLQGVIHGCHVFGPDMVSAGRGHVVNVASGLAYFPRATEPAYVTTKAAVLALSRCLRADWARAGVGVSAVCPGVIATPITERTRFRGDRARPETVRKVRDTFARRGHPPDKVAAAIVTAIERNRPVVPVGPEAWVGWLLRGVVPSRLGDYLAVASPGGV